MGIQDDQEKANSYLNSEGCSSTSHKDNLPQGQFLKKGMLVGHCAVLSISFDQTPSYEAGIVFNLPFIFYFFFEKEGTSEPEAGREKEKWGSLFF